MVASVINNTKWSKSLRCIQPKQKLVAHDDAQQQQHQEKGDHDDQQVCIVDYV
jgi:hypothetical protein